MRTAVYSILTVLIHSAAIHAGNINLPGKLTSTLGSEYDPCISSDGSRLLYTVDLAGDENIWVLNLKNKEKLQITRHTASDYSPCYLGKSKILFISRRANSLGDIYACNLKGEDQKPFKAGTGYFDMPASSRDGRSVAYAHAEGALAVGIYFYDPGNDTVSIGPKGISPEYFSAKDSIIYVSSAEGRIASRLAVFGIIDSSVSYLSTGDGIDLNPVVMPDGQGILFDKISRDTDDDGKLTVNDDSDLMIYDIGDNNTKRIFPGFHFSDPTISENGILCVRGKDGHIYLISSDGISQKQSDYTSQIELCDSLVSSAQNSYDSLVAAAACYEGYYYYPDDCKDLILRSCILYSHINEHLLALAVLSEVENTEDREFLYSAKLTEAEIRYQVWKSRKDYRERVKVIDICNRLLSDTSVAESLGKRANQFAIEFYFNEKMFEKGGEIIDSAMARNGGDRDFAAELERWKLKYLSYTYAGDIGDLVPLHVNLIEKYKLRGSIDKEVISDLIALIRDKKPENSVEILESIRQNYSWHALLSGAASLEQAKLLAKSNQRSLAEWRLNEILGNYKEMPELRFSAFEELFEIYLHFNDFNKAISAADSASAYLDYTNDRQLARTFMNKAAELYTYLGYRDIDSNPRAARAMFTTALSFDGGNNNALRGLATAGYDDGNVNNQSQLISIIGPARFKCLQGYTNILLYQKNSRLEYLKKARNYFIEAIEMDPADILPYLSLGYVDCRLEERSSSGLGLYEEALEYSIRGLAYAGDDRNFASGIYLNIAEAYFGLIQYEDAFNFYKKALDYNGDLGDSINFCYKFGESAFQIDSLAIAENYFERSYNYAAGSGDEKEKASSALKLGLVKQALGDYIEAAEYYQVAMPYYSASGDRKIETDILKGQSFCIKMSGDQKAARTFATDAIAQFNRGKYKGETYDNRVKFILWPFGIKIPLIKLLPMRFGGSLYPIGFTSAATDAFIMEMSEGGGDAVSEISLKKGQIDVLDESKEEENSIDLWHRMGTTYGKIGYADSSISSFKTAYKLCMDLEDYHGAYIELLNRAEIIFSNYPPSNSTERLKALKEIEDKALNLYDYILPSYPDARANLKNIAGLAEYTAGIIEAGNPDLGEQSSIMGLLSDLDKNAQNAAARFTRAGYYFKEALVGLTPGQYSQLEAALLLNDAVASLTLGDIDGFNSSIQRARKAAILAESPEIYAMVVGISAVEKSYPDSQDISSLREAVRILEDLTVAGEIPVNDGFMNYLYRIIIAYELNNGDYYGAIRNLEASKMLSEISNIMPFSSVFYKSDNFRANLDLLRRYQSEILKLESQKRRLSARGGTGAISLSSVNDEILEKRGRFLEIKQDLKEIDPVTYSSLVFDVPSIVGTLKLIPEDEACIVPYRTENSYAVWICKKDTMEVFRSQDIEELASNIPSFIDNNCSIITIASLDSIGNEISKRMHDVILKNSIRRSASLSDAYREGISDIRSAVGIAIVRGDGYVLSDKFADEIGATVYECDSSILGTDFSGYGWIILDGRIYRDKDNILLSNWKEAGINHEDSSRVAIYLKNLPGLKNDAFGMIILNSGDELSDKEKTILIKAAENSGVSSVIECEPSSGNQELKNRLREYIGGLGNKSPIESFSDTFAGRDDNIIALYYGDRGWRKDTEESEFRKLYSQYLVAGNQYFLTRNWNMAARYYISALEISNRSNIQAAGRGPAVINLLDCYRQTDRYEANLLRHLSEYESILEESGDSLIAASLYRDAANIEYEKRDYHAATEFAGTLIEKSEILGDDSLQAAGYAIQGKARFQTGELESAEEDLKTATELLAGREGDDEFISLKLNLAAIYNLKEWWGRSKLILDSLRQYMNKEGVDKNIYSEYIIEKSKYNIGTFRNGTAKKDLKNLVNMVIKSPQAKLLLAEIYLMRSQTDSAKAEALGAGKAGGRRSEGLFARDYHELLGDIYRFEGKQGEAVIQYNLAKEGLADFKYRDPVDILDYKIIISEDTSGVDRDSLLMQLLDSGSGRVKDLCRYRLGQKAAQKGNRSLAESLFHEILNTDNNFSARYLKWRACYYLGLVSEGAERSRYFATADEILRKLPGEPGYIKQYYGLNESGSDLYNSLADLEISRNSPDSAVNLMEMGFARKISGGYFAIGEFDSTENIILDSLFSDTYEKSEAGDKSALIDGIKSDEKYSIFWGNANRNVRDLRQNLKNDEAVLRFYERDNGFMIAWIDRDTAIVREFPVDKTGLINTLEKMNDLLANQTRADSAMEKWYVDFISQFENLLFKKEKLLIIPDGPLYFFPFEALKMPEGDYLSEMYSMSRHAFLPSEFPPEITTPAYPVLSLEPGLGKALRLVNYIAEPLTGVPDSQDAAITFYSGEFTIFNETPIINNRILCEVEPMPVKQYERLQLQAIMASRVGDDGFAYPLWNLQDDVRSAYYWKFLTKLANGTGFRQSNSSARSYIYGHYDGLPYFWAGNVYVNLN